MHLEVQTVESALLARACIDHLDLPALLLRPLAVHAKQVGREQRRLLPAFGALDLDDDVAVVVRILGQEQDLQLLLELADPLGGSALLAVQVLLHLLILLVLEHLVGGLGFLLGAPELLVGAHDLAEGALLARQFRQLLVVGSDFRTPHLRLDLVIALPDRLKAINHAAADSSSPSRAALNAQSATSSMSSVGSRVVNF